jgi:hypothetical protein
VAPPRDRNFAKTRHPPAELTTPPSSAAGPSTTPIDGAAAQTKPTELLHICAVHASTLGGPPGPSGASQEPQHRQNPPSTNSAHDPSFQHRRSLVHPHGRRRRSNKYHRAFPCMCRACCDFGRAARTLWSLPGAADSPKPVVTQLSSRGPLRAPPVPHAPPSTALPLKQSPQSCSMHRPCMLGPFLGRKNPVMPPRGRNIAKTRHQSAVPQDVAPAQSVDHATPATHIPSK